MLKNSHKALQGIITTTLKLDRSCFTCFWRATNPDSTYHPLCHAGPISWWRIMSVARYHSVVSFMKHGLVAKRSCAASWENKMRLSLVHC
ncbi:uncharacterized protein BKA55DRAFT_578170 [Fusarium redolens]|uniref:Uncharacterized protein n=1 Tax=Fusarium redolens TaxID=48865 RepID=A0A9P9GDT5_FUSRE|nr:uncharacterized protein BKA55DRAFT_578170 [Fusarium redolens]KAH7237708.1 hypothetical protein BKA55DRAFT_578170 [Fusarium redolens]